MNTEMSRTFIQNQVVSELERVCEIFSYSSQDLVGLNNNTKMLATETEK